MVYNVIVKEVIKMPIQWFNEEKKTLVATIATANITLNKPAKNLIDDAYSVIIGISPEDKRAYIKALDKETIEKGIYPKSQLYTVTIRSSYGRISNKAFIKTISDMINESFDTPKKYEIEYDEDEHMLIIDLKKEVL